MSNADPRPSLRAARRALSHAEQAAASVAVAARLTAWRPFQTGQLVAGYVADDGELDPAPALDRARESGATVALPALDGDAMAFRIHRIGEPLGPGRFGLLEPTGAEVAAEQLDVVLVPLVGFDADCRRIGRGAGYYDRAFAFLAEATRPPAKPLLVGLAHDLQELPSLTANPTDVRLDAVVTPTRLVLAP